MSLKNKDNFKTIFQQYLLRNFISSDYFPLNFFIALGAAIGIAFSPSAIAQPLPSGLPPSSTSSLNPSPIPLPIPSLTSVLTSGPAKPDSTFLNVPKLFPSLNEDSLAQSKADSNYISDSTKNANALEKIVVLPFEMKKPSPQEILVFQRLVLRSVMALNKKDYAKAIKYLQQTNPTEKLAQVYRSSLLAKAFIGQKDFNHADSILKASLLWVGGNVWQNHLLNLRLETFPLTSPNDSAKKDFYQNTLQGPLVSSISNSVKINFLYGLLKLNNFSGKAQGFEEILSELSQIAPADKRLDSLYTVFIPTLPKISNENLQQQILALDIETKLSLWIPAIARVQELINRTTAVEQKKNYSWTLINLYFKNKDFEKVIQSAEKFIQNYGDSPDAILLKAKAYDRLKDSKKALIEYDRFMEKFPKHEKSAEIFWLRAWDLEAQGNYTEAMEYYYRELLNFSSNKRSDWANFRVGLCQYKAGNFSSALAAFIAIRNQANSNAYGAGMFWEGKMNLLLGDTAKAHSAWMELNNKYPFSFYGHLAKTNLVEGGFWSDSLETARHFASSHPEGIKAWMKNAFPSFRENLTNEFESDYLSLGKLMQFKLDTLALLTLKTMPDKVRANPWFLYVYSKKLQDRQLFHESYKLALQLGSKMNPDQWGQAPKEVLRLIFPRPFEGIVQKYAANRSLDPAFIYALMRQESGFEKDVKSGAGAIGLMQMMPATGKNMAKKVKLKNFDPYTLIDPEVNINLGTAYLKELKKEFKGNPYYALANYNAGPEPAKRWQTAAANKPLELGIEEISFWETRDYVKKVMGNFWTYRMLWKNPKKVEPEMDHPAPAPSLVPTPATAGSITPTPILTPDRPLVPTDSLTPTPIPSPTPIVPPN